MRILALDWESYYDKDVNLRKMNIMEYVNHPKFKVTGIAARWVGEEPNAQWYNEEEVQDFIESIDWPNTAVLAHHTDFDCYILSQLYNAKPAFHYDTMAMSRGRWPAQSASLESLLLRLFPNDETKRKGKELANAKGIETYSPELDELIGKYACNDVDTMVSAFEVLIKDYPPEELKVIDIVCRMFTQPKFVLDKSMTVKHRDDAKKNSQDKVALAGIPKEVLGSSDQFAAYVRDVLKITVPMKQGKNKLIPALGKNDISFQNLQKQYPQHKAIWEARLATKSRIDETRAGRLLGGTNKDGTLSVPIRYYAAHTGRFGGAEKLNLQNLKRGSNLRKALCAPEGYMVIVADKSQIEARLTAWLAGCDKLTQAFRNKEDPYAKFASVIYKRLITKSDPIERFVGKTCLAEGTLVYTQEGMVPIEQIQPYHKVWDGDNWVCQQGKIYQGFKQTVQLCGVSLTPDHKVWCGNNWRETQSLVKDENSLRQALEHAADCSPSLDILPEAKEGSNLSLSNANVTPMNTLSIPTISRTSNQRDARIAVPETEVSNATGSTPKQCQKLNTEHDCSIDSPPRWNGVITLKVKPMNIMERAVSVLRYRGEIIAKNFSGIYKHSRAGISHLLKWIGLTTTKDMNRGIFDSFREKPTWQTDDQSENFSDESKSLKHVWDIANAGPNHRFMIHTNRGPLIVSNCILGLGFGVGGVKLQVTLESGSQGPVVVITELRAREIVSQYRMEFPEIPSLWKKLEEIFVWIQNPNFYGKTYGPLTAIADGFQLPNGMVMCYPEAAGLTFYDSRYKMRKKLWGGVLTENLIQALARCNIADDMVTLDDYFKLKPEYDAQVVLQVHDEIICIAKQEFAQEIYNKMHEVMTTPPSWAPDLPLAAEGGFAREYSK